MDRPLDHDIEPSSLWRSFALACGIACIGFLVFLPAVKNAGFVYDDRLHLAENLSLSHRDGWWHILSLPLFPGSLYRPVTFLSFWGQTFLLHSGKSALFFGNALLHGVNSALCFFLFLRVLFPSPEYPTERKQSLAVFLALLFAVHPLHVEAVANGVGRAELLALACGLTGVLLSLRRFSSLFLHTTVIALFFFLAAGAKESGVLFPLLSLSVLVFLGETRKQLLSVIFGGTVAISGYLALRIAVIGTISPPHFIDFVDNPLAHLDFDARFLHASFLLAQYISRLVFPFPLSADYSYAVVSPLVDPWSSIPLFGASLLVISLFALSVFGVVRRSPIAWGILWFFLSFLLTSNLFFPIGTPFGERLAYTPSVGLLCSLGLLSIRLCGLRGATLLGGGYLLVCLGITLSAQQHWFSQEALFRYQQRVSPMSVKTLVNVSALERSDGDLQEATALLERALEIAPDSSDVLFARAAIALQQREDQDGELLLRRSLGSNPRHLPSVDALARLLTKQGALEEAKRLILFGLERDPIYERLLIAHLYWAITARDLVLAEKIDAQLRELGSADSNYLELQAVLWSSSRVGKNEQRKAK
ncbi:DUF1736 domain-containing protein [bacterium]|nr:DUF1736 domain-containing protein [bacterium]